MVPSVNSSDDWIKAQLIADDGKNQKVAEAKIRLKGDWADHIRDSQKLSFRSRNLD